VRRSDLLFDRDSVATPAFQHFLLDMQILGIKLVEVDDALQARFFQKGPSNQPKERWELDQVTVSCPPKQFRRHLDLCGFGMKTIPQHWNYNYAAWPGALLVRAVARLQDLLEAWAAGVRWRQTVVLGGKRPLQPQETPVEGYKLLGINAPDATNFKTRNVKTELEMMHWLWEQADLPGEMRKTALFVNAPMKPPKKIGDPLVRPNTEDTIHAWLLQLPTPGGVLLSSGAPYGMAQDEAFWTLLGPKGYAMETFGHELPPNLPVASIMKEVAGTVNRIRKARNM
jgi:hypothetical protein